MSAPTGANGRTLAYFRLDDVLVYRYQADVPSRVARRVAHDEAMMVTLDPPHVRVFPATDPMNA